MVTSKMKTIKMATASLAVAVVAATSGCRVLEKRTPESFVESARRHSAKGDNGRAIRDYSKALELDGSNYAARWERALAEESMDSLERAIDDFGVCIESMRPRESEADRRILEGALMRRAACMMRMGYRSDACSDWTDACELNVSSAPCNSLRANCR